MNYDEYDAALNELDKACLTLAKWHHEGRKLPGYILKNGVVYLCTLVDKPYKGVAEAAIMLYKEHPGLLANIAGEHGWAIIRTLIIRARPRMHKAAKDKLSKQIRNKKRRDWRFLQKEG